MDVLALLTVLLLLLVVLWVLLLCKGVDPARLLRSAFKSPQHYLTPSSYAERERLLSAVPPGPRTGQTLLYSDTMARLAECTATPEIEELLQFIALQRLVNTDIKAQHFAQHCRRRMCLVDLTAAALAVIVTNLQRYAKYEGVAECIRACFEATHGAACLALKDEVERHVSVYRLVFHYIRSASVREALLQHFEREAAALTAEPEFVRPIKLLCDIDDTMISILFDTRYPELTVYPGVHQFVEELLERESSRAGTASSARITFLTARPEIMRTRSIRQLRASGFFHFNLLMGKLSSVVLGPRRIAAGKLENFENFRRIFAEHQFVFVGDNGQGDIDLGMDLLRHPERYGVAVVLIHDVIRNHVRDAALLPGAAIAPYRRDECAKHGIHLFQTYISAIAHLYACGMVDADAVLRVIRKTTAAHTSIQYESHAQQESVALEIAADVALVVAALPELHAHETLACMPCELLELVTTRQVANADAVV